MFIKNVPLRQTFCPCGHNIVRTNDLQHTGACLPCLGCNSGKSICNTGKNEILESAYAIWWQPSKFYREKQNQHHGKPETRNGNSCKCNDHADTVCDSVLMYCCCNSKWCTDYDLKKHTDQGDDKGVRKSV